MWSKGGSSYPSVVLRIDISISKGLGLFEVNMIEIEIRRLLRLKWISRVTPPLPKVYIKILYAIHKGLYTNTRWNKEMFIQQSVRSVRLCLISCGEGSGHPVAMWSKCERGNDSSGLQHTCIQMCGFKWSPSQRTLSRVALGGLAGGSLPTDWSVTRALTIILSTCLRSLKLSFWSFRSDPIRCTNVISKCLLVPDYSFGFSFGYASWTIIFRSELNWAKILAWWWRWFDHSRCRSLVNTLRPSVVDMWE